MRKLEDTGCPRCNAIQEWSNDPTAMCDDCHIEWCDAQIVMNLKEIERLKTVKAICESYKNNGSNTKQ